MTSKAVLRQTLRTKRSALPAHKRENYTQRACAQLQYFLEKAIGICALYMPIQDEISPLPVTETMSNMWTMPVTTKETMHFAKWSPEIAMQSSSFDIPEPTHGDEITPDIIITPLLGFDKHGHRIGYGKGYYDRYFADVAPDALRIGFAFSCQQCHDIQHDPHDIRLHATITEHGMMRHKI